MRAAIAQVDACAPACLCRCWPRLAMRFTNIGPKIACDTAHSTAARLLKAGDIEARAVSCHAGTRPASAVSWSPAGPDQAPGEGNGSVHGGCCVTTNQKAACAWSRQNRREDCSRLPFDTMRVVESIREVSVQIVRCSEIRQGGQAVTLQNC